jgi:hypothetical protein
MLCYNKLVSHVILEHKIKLRKYVVSYFKNNGITTKKHVDVDHGIIVKNIEKEMYSSLKSPLERQLAKKRHAMNASVISNFWGP